MGMSFTEQLTQGLAVVGYIPPTNHAANTDNSIAGIDMSHFVRLITYVQLGVSAGGNLQLYYQASSQSNMVNPVNVASAVGWTVNTANRISSLEVRADQLPAGTRYIQPCFVTNTAANFSSVLVLGDSSAYKPASQWTITNTLDTAGVIS